MRLNPTVKLSGDRNECPSCGELFNSVAAFDKHRTGTFGGPHNQPAKRRCLTRDEMMAKGMEKNTAGFWVTKLRDENALASLPPNAGSDFPRPVDPR
jgi:hypothetical protein